MVDDYYTAPNLPGSVRLICMHFALIITVQVAEKSVSLAHSSIARVGDRRRVVVGGLTV